jgi:predicted small metal-binding protein
MPSFKCKDIGMQCPFEAKANTRAELMKKITEHAAKAHNMKAPFPPDMTEKINKAIKP